MHCCQLVSAAAEDQLPRRHYAAAPTSLFRCIWRPDLWQVRIKWYWLCSLCVPAAQLIMMHYSNPQIYITHHMTRNVKYNKIGLIYISPRLPPSRNRNTGATGTWRLSGEHSAPGCIIQWLSAVVQAVNAQQIMVAHGHPALAQRISQPDLVLGLTLAADHVAFLLLLVEFSTSTFR